MANADFRSMVLKSMNSVLDDVFLISHAGIDVEGVKKCRQQGQVM